MRFKLTPHMNLSLMWQHKISATSNAYLLCDVTTSTHHKFKVFLCGFLPLDKNIDCFCTFSDWAFSCSFQFSCLVENPPVAGGSWPAAVVASWLCNEQQPVGFPPHNCTVQLRPTKGQNANTMQIMQKWWKYEQWSKAWGPQVMQPISFISAG